MTEQVPNCQHCRQPAELATGKDIYPHRFDLHGLYFWRCKPCRAYVGCHKPNVGYGDGTRPLGTPANAYLRQLRNSAHDVFDPLWRGGRYKRRELYALLALELMIPIHECHIAMFDEARCKATIEFANKFKAVYE